MTISRDDVRHCAELARLALSPEEEALFEEQLGRILEYVAQLQTVDVEGVEPFISAAARGNVFRADTAGESLSVDQALANAPQRDRAGFVVPRVVEH